MLVVTIQALNKHYSSFSCKTPYKTKMKNSITVYSRYYRVISALFWGSIQHWQNISFAPKQHKYLRIEPTQRGLTAITFVSITPLKQRIFDRRLLSGFSTKILTVSSDTSPLIANVASLNYNWPILRNIGMLNRKPFAYTPPDTKQHRTKLWSHPSTDNVTL